MAATVRGATGAASTSSGSTSITITETAASPQAGDIRYLFINTATTVTPTLPAGWAVVLPVTNVGSGNLAVASKRWVAGVGSETVTFGTTALSAYEIVAVSGADQDLTPQIVTNGGAAATTLTSASVTPTVGDGLLLVYFAQTESATSSTTLFGGTNPATIPGVTVLDSRAGGATSGYAVAVGALPTTGAPTGAFSATSDHSGAWRTAALLIPSSAAPYSLFGWDEPNPAGAGLANASTGFSLGTEFGVTAPCWITAIRYYKATTANYGTPTGRLYSVTTATTGVAVPGTDVTFTGLGSTTAAGWKSVALATPILLTVGQHYRVAGYFANGTTFTATNSYWATGPGASDVVNGPITGYAQTHATGSIQGSFVAQTTGTFPVYPTTLASPAGNNYWVDPVVTDVDPFALPAPVVVSQAVRRAATY